MFVCRSGARDEGLILTAEHCAELAIQQSRGWENRTVRDRLKIFGFELRAPATDLILASLFLFLPSHYASSTAQDMWIPALFGLRSTHTYIGIV